MSSFYQWSRKTNVNGHVVEQTWESSNGPPNRNDPNFNAFMNQIGGTSEWQFNDGFETTAYGNESWKNEQDNDQGSEWTEQQSAPSNEVRAGFTVVQSACQLSALNLHNSLRKRHGVHALVLDDAISHKAQSYAEYLAKNNLFQHSTDRNGLGENLHTSWSSQPLIDGDHGQQATQNWYDEIKAYNFNNPKFSSNTGHFTQIVWKGTKKLGVGIAFADGNRKVIVVANYSPAGNMQGAFPENVLPPN